MNMMPGNAQLGMNSFQVTELADRDTPNSAKYGVDPGEFLEMSFSATYTGVTNALQAGTLRIGMHVGSYLVGPDGSESFIVGTVPVPGLPPGFNPQNVPVPGAMLLGCLGLGFSANMLKRRKS
jgi:hypothetical protein